MVDFVPIKDSLLPTDKLTLKQTWDAEWKASSDLHAHDFYAKKREGKTTKQEEVAFLAEDAALWSAEVQRRIGAGLYEQISKARLESKLTVLQAEAAELDTKIKAMG